MARLNTNTLREKLVWLIMAASVSALLVVVAAAVVYEATTFRPRVREQLNQEAFILRQVLLAPLAFDDKDSAANYLKTRQALPEIAAAAVYDSSGLLFASYRRTNVAPAAVPPVAQPGGLEFSQGQVAFWQPLEHGTGHLYLLRDLPPLYARLAQYAIPLGAVLLALLLVGIMLLRGVHRNFLGPLADLVQTTDRITRNNDYALRARVQQEDELGALARSFNLMLDAVGERDSALRAASAHLQSVFAAATEVAIIATDAEGKVTLFNTGAERMLRYPATEVIGQATPELWHLPEEAQALAAEVSAQLGRTVGGFEGMVHLARIGQQGAREWTFVRKDGSRFPVQLVVTAVRDPQDRITGYLGVASDISERKGIESQLRQREERFRSLIENASDMITVMNRAGVIRYQSPSAERVLGYPPEKLTGLNVFTLVHPADVALARKSMQQAYQNKTQLTISLRLRHADGSWRQIEAIGRGLQESIDGGKVIINARDITDSTKLEEQLRQTQKLEAIGQLSGGVAHDFNNILTAIMGHTGLLGLDQSLSADGRESLAEIKRSSERAANLTRQLLAFSRRQAMQLVHLDLNVVVAEMTKMLQRILGEDIRMQLQPTPQATTILADASMMEQILLNLAVNARDAMPGGGRLIIETEVRTIDASMVALMSQSRPGEFMCLSVSDTGCGIAPEILPRIFEPFFTTKDVGKGTGLGLATVYGIVQQHQGWIHCYSEVGRGTVFRVYLPLVTAAEPASAAPKAALASLPRGHETILLVEDETSVRTLVRNLLSKQGYRIIEAASGVSALEIWRRQGPAIDLLLTDLVMPDGVGGRELAAQLAVDKPGLPVIYTSGYSTELASKGLKLKDGDKFLAKPFTPLQLLEAVQTSLQWRTRDH
ncbi:MAG: PAS domain S-box protein [Lacunisphaera sp.]|nr:PAS domain S-box protein [Lacunisphaera sp.]